MIEWPTGQEEDGPAEEAHRKDQGDQQEVFDASHPHVEGRQVLVDSPENLSGSHGPYPVVQVHHIVEVNAL
jgi:hypothetical protein